MGVRGEVRRDPHARRAAIGEGPTWSRTLQGLTRDLADVARVIEALPGGELVLHGEVAFAAFAAQTAASGDTVRAATPAYGRWVREEPQRIAGRLEATLRIPDAAPTAIVVIAHPLPTHGGTMRNPLMTALARAAAEHGWYALRFNFRGVGASAGEWTDGRDEPRDLGDAVAHARGIAPRLPVGVVGFSFGAVMVLRWIADGGRPDAYALLGLPLRSTRGEPRELPRVPDGAFIVNGEHDEFGSPEEVALAYPQARVVAVRSADHFFTGKRDELVRIVTDRLQEAFGR